MSNIIIQYDGFIRLSAFIFMLIIMGILENVTPRRALTESRAKRWASNLSITALNSVLLRFIFPISAVVVAFYADDNHLGLFNSVLKINDLWAVIISILIFDLVIYWQHRLFHVIPVLWRVHRMHHVDLDIDVSTGVRFHPIEIILSLLIKYATIIVIGAPALSVVLFQVILNATSMFNHSNIHLPFLLDKIIRLIIVTPDMHRVHHSDIVVETNSNYGFNLSIWDKIFGSYRAQPSLGHLGMMIGIKEIRDTKDCVNLVGMLKLPFMKKS